MPVDAAPQPVRGEEVRQTAGGSDGAQNKIERASESDPRREGALSHEEAGFLLDSRPCTHPH
jgi:hypothetical protein